MSAHATTRMNAVKLRAVLAAILLLLMGLGIVVFMLGYQQITLFSKETQQIAKDAEASNSKLQQLSETKQQLALHADTVERASQLVAASKLYEYQDQIINDLSSYGTKAGVEIETITFNDGSQDSSAASTTTQPAATALPSGIKTTTATVTLKNPVKYTAFMNFIHSLEQGIFRMSIRGIDISRSSETGGSDPITSSPINIEVYIR